MRKILCLMVLLLILTGCSKENKINYSYDSVELNIIGTINAGCNSSEDTYLSHHYKDRHTYKLDFKNETDYYTSDIWTVYNVGNKQYLSYDHGQNFEEVESSGFETNYRQLFNEMLEIIKESDKNIISETKNSKEYEIRVAGKENTIFVLLKKFGITSDDKIINELKLNITVNSESNITKISFNLKTTVSEEINIQSCYDVYWNLSDYNSSDIKIEI